MTATVPERVRHLAHEVRRLERARLPESDSAVSSGCPPLDAVLPAGGFRLGSLVEWLGPVMGGGVRGFALRAAAAACGPSLGATPTGDTPQPRSLVVIDPEGVLYPPAVWAAGIDLERTAWVRAQRVVDQHWAALEALRCPGVGAVMWWPARLDDRQFRRLQLAAEQAGSLGLLIRSAACRHQPSWADVRIEVEPRRLASRPRARISAASETRGFRLTVLRARGAAVRQTVEVQWDDATNTVRVVPPLAPATVAGATARVAGAGRGGG